MRLQGNLLHFMNSFFDNPGIYSCAIDCFLEVSRYLFQPAFLDLSVRTEFIDLLHNALLEYSNISEKTSNTLPQVREPVWYYLRQHCSTLLPRDSNASFSQIFEERTFGKLNPDEMNLFMTQRTFESHCQTCQKTVTSNMKLFLIYVSNSSLKQTGFDISCWPMSVSHIFKKPKKIVCKHCSESNVSDPICTSVVNSKFVFIEFSDEIVNCVTIHEHTEFDNSSYTLHGLVRCYQRHFTCAIKIENKWIYFDDMCNTVQEFTSLNQLFSYYREGHECQLPTTKRGNTLSVTAFGRILAAFLNEDVYEYRNDVDKLTEKLLMLESTDFHISQNGRLVTKMQSH